MRNIIFGVVGEDIFNPPGGLFFGLIKYKQDRIRPTFLQQTNFKSFKFDTKLKTLVLSSKNLIDSNIKDTIKIVDLRPFGCPGKIVILDTKISYLIIYYISVSICSISEKINY